jgi:peptide/nickel transport system substrate-binding protein
VTRRSRRNELGRRELFAALLATGATALVTRRSGALGRTPLGGTLRLSLPFAPGPLDPHSADDPLSALVAPAFADPLYVLDADKNPHPALAAALPDAASNGARVVLRAGLTSARGRTLDAKDLLWSLARARERGGVALLAELPKPVKDANDPLALRFPDADAKTVALALASPVTALVPRGFEPRTPDGTGAFRATLAATGLLLERNPSAARGPSFLTRIEVALGGDLAESLRAFEAERADVGWLGAGLYRARAGAVPFEGPTYGWVVLRVGHDAGHWAAPGLAQGLLDRVPRAPLAPLGLVAPNGATTAGAAWGGGNVELLVPAGAPQLVEIAKQIAAAFSVQGQRVSVRPLAAAEALERKASGRYALLLDFVRTLGPPGRATLLALLAAANPALAARPPHVPSEDPLDLARTLPLGVVGALRVAGARAADVRALDGWQLGNVYRAGGSG